jgi:hypothetical protein
MKTGLAYSGFLALLAVACLLLLDWKAALGITLLTGFLIGAVFFYVRPSYRYYADAKRQITDKDLLAAERFHRESARYQHPGPPTV